jgi:hypothetical protein
LRKSKRRISLEKRRKRKRKKRKEEPKAKITNLVSIKIR